MVEENVELLNINLNEELENYCLDGKWNDYVGVQKIVIEVLKQENYFENNEIENIESGMKIRITSRGIKETLGKGKRFQNLPKMLKQLKIATVRKLPQIIQMGHVFEDNMANIHGDAALFAYIIASIRVDNIVYSVRVAVKKRVGDNIFWIHNIDCKKISPELLDLRSVRIGN